MTLLIIVDSPAALCVGYRRQKDLAGKGEGKTGKSPRKPVQRAESIFSGREHISFPSSRAPPVPTYYPIHKIYVCIGLQLTTNSIKMNTVNDLPIVVECSSSTEIATAAAVFIVCR